MTATPETQGPAQQSVAAQPVAVPGPTSKHRRLPPRRWLIALILIGVPVIWGLVQWHHAGALIGAMITLAVFWLLILGLLEWAGKNDGNPKRSKYGFIDVVIGADGRVSTSQTMVFAWTAVFASALIVLTCLVVAGKQASQIFNTDGGWDAYFLLLGGPFASAVIAKGIVSYQTQDPNAKSGTTAAASSANAMTATTSDDPSVRDVVSGDSNAPSLVDTQYTVFSLVAIVYFVGVFAANLHQYATHGAGSGTVLLPAIPSALLGLTGLSALTYVGNKAVQTQGLRVVTFSPNPVGTSQSVEAKLVNLPDGANMDNTQVWIADADGNVLTAGAPSGVASGVVTFAAPAIAGTYTVTIAAPDTYTGPSKLVVQ